MNEERIETVNLNSFSFDLRQNLGDLKKKGELMMNLTGSFESDTTYGMQNIECQNIHSKYPIRWTACFQVTKIRSLK